MPNAGLNRASRRAAAKAARRSPAATRGKRLAAGLGAMGLAATGAVISAAPASAATFTVTTLADSGAGSLRDAIDDANSAPGADVITFASTLTGTITLTTGQLVIDGSVTIEGPGSDKLSVSGNDESRVFFIGSSSEDDLDDVTIKGLTVTHGNAVDNDEGDDGDGGAIFSRDQINFTLLDSVVSDSVADGDGGGVFMHLDGGSVTITNVAITGNSAPGSDGGGLFVEHTVVTLSHVQVTGNTAEYGGGIYSEAILALSDSTVSGNDADGGSGGGLWISSYAYDYASLQSDGSAITNTVIAGNTATYTAGGLALSSETGRIYTGGESSAPILTTTTLSGLTIDGNSAVYGGGIGAYGAGAVDVTDTTISNNTAAFAGGVAASARGGASDLAAAVIVDEDFNLLSIGFVNATIAGNKATETDVVTAVSLFGASASFDHTTVAGNTGDGPAIAVQAQQQQARTAGAQGTPRGDAAEDGRRHSAAPAASAEPQVQQLPAATVTLRNSIASNVGSKTDLSEGDFMVSYSLVGTPGPQPVMNGTGGNIVGADPKLGPLANNGGSTLTLLPANGSPAVNAGNAAVGVAPALDQRGAPRVSGVATDMGAVEIQLALVATGPVDAIRNDGESVSFTAAATGDPTITVKWQVSADGGATWTDVVGATEPTLTFTALLEQDGLRFRAVFSNGAGSVTTNSALLTVLGLAKTGAEVNQALPLGAALVAMGAAMTAFARRRRTS